MNSNNGVNHQNGQQPWYGANQQQQLLYQKQQQLQSLNSQSKLNPATNYAGGNTGPGAARPIRFPGDASNRFDQGHYSDELQNYYDYPDYSDAMVQVSAPTPDGSSSNIIAELSKFSTHPKNLIYRGQDGQDPYIRYLDSSESGSYPGDFANSGSNQHLELIMYPSGQLLLGNQEQSLALPGTAIGPHLRNYLSGQSSLQHSQRPHYVFAKKKITKQQQPQHQHQYQSLPVYERPTELFDPMLEGDEDYPTSRVDNVKQDNSASSSNSGSSGGLWPILVRTAKDDLNFMGNVLKTVLSRRR